MTTAVQYAINLYSPAFLLLLQFFLQLKGDMCLKIVEGNKHKDVHIKEGEVSCIHTAHFAA